MARQWGFRKRERGQLNLTGLSGISGFFQNLNYADLIGRTTLGFCVGIGIWLLEVIWVFNQDTRVSRNSVKEADPDWTIGVLVSMPYLALPIILGLLTMLVPSLMIRFMPDMSNIDTRDLDHNDF